MKKLVFSIVLFLGMIVNAQQLLEVLKPFSQNNSEEDRLGMYLATGDCSLLSRAMDAGLGVPDDSWYHVRLILPGGINVCYMHPPHPQTYILEATEVIFPWLELPYSGKGGEDIASVAKLLSGFVHQDSNYLQRNNIDSNYILLDTSFPRSNVVIETHKAADIP